MASIYKNTLLLPSTEFAMRANLVQKEPKLLAYWKQINLWEKVREQSKGRDKFILHDGPPYANGHIHIGTALNKLLKDTINRFQQMNGKDASYVPGWDCHGLPIEWVIEQEMQARGENQEDLPLQAFRQRCRAFAKNWMEVQGQEFQRLGVLGDWDHPYTTMAKRSEARILEELFRFLMDGSLYRSRKVVLWSVAEKTSLADAEVEYGKTTSNSAYFLFPVQSDSTGEPDLAVAAWTTTAWTIPCNQALAYYAGRSYGVYQIQAPHRLACSQLIIADECAARFTKHTGLTLRRLRAIDLKDTVCRHPLHKQGYTAPVPLYHADFVTEDAGTGIVHIAPDHGKDDFAVSREHGFAVEVKVQPDGTYVDTLPLFAGEHIFEVGDKVLQALANEKMLVATRQFTHENAYSGRSKAPLIFRSTWQWFISMEERQLRAKSLAAMDNIQFHPEVSRNTLHATLASRPDWLISRQRRWGVPLAFFLDKKTMEPLKDAEVNANIINIVSREGSDAWFDLPAERFLPSRYQADDYVKVNDIIDIWFEAGATYSFVLEQNTHLSFPADLYLEGSDQHRGWFQASLMLACGTRNRSPFKQLFTHGFVLDAAGHKMSKSLGNTIAPQTLLAKYGADILRLWAANMNYHDNVCVGDEILEQMADHYRKFRNVLRFILGNLRQETPQKVTDYQQLPTLEKYILHRLYQLQEAIQLHIDRFEIREICVRLLRFCDEELSAFYLDIRKDVLYCDELQSVRRQAANSVLGEIFSWLVRFLAPLLPFTAEEAWLSLPRAVGDSVHLQCFPARHPEWQLDEEQQARWRTQLSVYQLVTEAMEQARQERTVRESTEAVVTLHSGQEREFDLDLLTEICLVAEVRVSALPAPETAYRQKDIAITISKCSGEACQRCRRRYSRQSGDSKLCYRCSLLIKKMQSSLEVTS